MRIFKKLLTTTLLSACVALNAHSQWVTRKFAKNEFDSPYETWVHCIKDQTESWAFCVQQKEQESSFFMQNIETFSMGWMCNDWEKKPALNVSINEKLAESQYSFTTIIHERHREQIAFRFDDEIFEQLEKATTMGIYDKNQCIKPKILRFIIEQPLPITRTRSKQGKGLGKWLYDTRPEIKEENQ